MKIWKDHPEDLAAWRDKAIAKRDAMLADNPDRIWDWEDYELPYIPSEYTISLSYAEWRKVCSG